MILENCLIQQAIEGNQEVINGLDPEHFLDQTNKEIFKVILKLQQPSYIAVKSAVNTDNSIRYKGTIHERLSEIENEVFGYTPIFIDEQKEEWQKSVFKRYAEQLLKVGTDICTLENAKDYIAQLSEIASCGVLSDYIDEYEWLAKKVLERSPTSVTENVLIVSDPVLIKIFGDRLKQRLYVVGGHPSMGKNILVDMLTVDLLKNYPGMYFSFDNTAAETATSLISVAAGVKYDNIDRAEMDSVEKERVNRMYQPNNKLLICEKKLTAKQIKADIERNVKKENIKFAILDYFTNIKLPFSREITRQFEEAAGIFKDICREYGIAMIVLSQLNADGDVKRAKALFEEAFYVVKIEGIREEMKRTIKIEKFKKGALRYFQVELCPEVGSIALL